MIDKWSKRLPQSRLSTCAKISVYFLLHVPISAHAVDVISQPPIWLGIPICYANIALPNFQNYPRTMAPQLQPNQLRLSCALCAHASIRSSIGLLTVVPQSQSQIVSAYLKASMILRPTRKCVSPTTKLWMLLPLARLECVYLTHMDVNTPCCLVMFITRLPSRPLGSGAATPSRLARVATARARRGGAASPGSPPPSPRLALLQAADSGRLGIRIARIGRGDDV